MIALVLSAALVAPPAALTRPAPKGAEFPVVVSLTMNGQVQRGGKAADEAALRADLERLTAGQTVAVCVRGMNDKVSDAFDRTVLASSGKFNTRFFLQNICPKESKPMSAGARR